MLVTFIYFIKVEILLDEEGWKDEARGVIKDIESYVKAIIFTIYVRS